MDVLYIVQNMYADVLSAFLCAWTYKNQRKIHVYRQSQGTFQINTQILKLAPVHFKRSAA